MNRIHFIWKVLIALLGLILLAMIVMRFIILPHYDKTANAILFSGPYPVSSRSRVLHDKAFVADLHADSLLWGRDLARKNSLGQLDLHRLVEAGIDLQIFSVVSKVPKSLNYRSNSADTDTLPLLFLASWRPPSTWFNPQQRALEQAREWKRLTDTTELELVLNKQDLAKDGVKSLLALEGINVLEGDLNILNNLHEAGFRMMGLAHFFDNGVAGSAHGLEKYGLTEFGQSLIPKLETLGITIDLAHASPATITDTLRLATKPVVYSHGGAQGICPGPRNLSDSQLRAIAKNGGVIGIGFWKGAVCDTSVAGIVRAIKYAVQIAGIDHVGLGSDFDGHVTTPFDVTGIPMLTEELLASGLSGNQVQKILGGNARRIFQNNLPD